MPYHHPAFAAAHACAEIVPSANPELSSWRRHPDDSQLTASNGASHPSKAGDPAQNSIGPSVIELPSDEEIIAWQENDKGNWHGEVLDLNGFDCHGSMDGLSEIVGLSQIALDDGRGDL